MSQDTTTHTATQGMLSKVRKLIETAESYEEMGTAEGRNAAEAYRAKAEKLMGEFRIQEEELIAKDPASLLPIRLDIDLLPDGKSPFQGTYLNLFAMIARHAGIKVAFDWKLMGRTYGIVGQSVGYESDLRYAEMLYTAVRMVFGEKLEPKVNPNLSDQVNAYRLRSAGMERVRVAELIWGNRDRANLSRVGRYYKAECAARGEAAALDGRGVTGKVYREQYAQEFVWSLGDRLRRGSDAAGSMGGGLTLHGRAERVEEAFYTHFPHLRPSTAVEVAEPEEECEACKKTKSASGYCRDHRPRTTSDSDYAARMRRYYSPAAVRGREAGQAAARHVDLGGTARTGNLDQGSDRKGLGA